MRREKGISGTQPRSLQQPMAHLMPEPAYLPWWALALLFPIQKEHGCDELPVKSRTLPAFTPPFEDLYIIHPCRIPNRKSLSDMVPPWGNWSLWVVLSQELYIL